jgi:hypothetical protein
LAALDSSWSSELSKEQKWRKAKALKKNTSRVGRGSDG